jgi:2-haloacid dehalogenase
MAKRASLPWDCILSAEIFHKYKPDPATYLGVARIFDVDPGEVMMVAAHQDDLAHARGCGLKTAYIERPEEYGCSQIKDVSPHPDNTLHARNLVELAVILGC